MDLLVSSPISLNLKYSIYKRLGEWPDKGKKDHLLKLLKKMILNKQEQSAQIIINWIQSLLMVEEEKIIKGNNI